jgi:NADH-quinone oxidoreductase subunit J
VNTPFYIAAIVSVVSTLMVITRRNPVHALLYLVVSLLSVALIFFILGAPFVAALEVIIYAGAIMVLFVFVIMMLNLGPESAKQESEWLGAEIWAGPTILVTILSAELVYVLVRAQEKVFNVSVVPPKQVGISLLGPYVLGVELASMLLLAGLVGAYHLGRRERSDGGGS